MSWQTNECFLLRKKLEECPESPYMLVAPDGPECPSRNGVIKGGAAHVIQVRGCVYLEGMTDDPDPPTGPHDEPCPPTDSELGSGSYINWCVNHACPDPVEGGVALLVVHLPCPLPAAQWPTGVGLPVAPPPGTEPASPCGGDDPSSLPPPYSGAEVSIVGAFPMTQSAFGNDPTWSQRILVAVEAPNVIAA